MMCGPMFIMSRLHEFDKMTYVQFNKKGVMLCYA